jgi:L-aspartate oxidase
MERYHPFLELAPRDVVARAITREAIGDDRQQLAVYLDMRHVTGIDLHKRFPGISGFLLQHGFELSRDLIPVRPAAHYLMGGVRTDVNGKTSMPCLYAAGEVACTGVHGANRLASNSLLEGLVFGVRAAAAMRECHPTSANQEQELHKYVRSPGADVFRMLKQLQQGMWQNAGLLRDVAGLSEMLLKLEGLYVIPASDRASLELANLHTVAELIVLSALAREESRGAHYRTDFPKREDAEFGKHSVIRGRQVSFQAAPQGALTR